MSKKYYLYVHNTMTGKTEKVAVSKEVYVCYKRTEWNIRANDRSFYKHEIQFSALLSDMESLSNMLGHTDCGFTMNTYIHATDKLKQSAADKMQSAFEVGFNQAESNNKIENTDTIQKR